jgi:hypothetical protein
LDLSKLPLTTASSVNTHNSTANTNLISSKLVASFEAQQLIAPACEHFLWNFFFVFSRPFRTFRRYFLEKIFFFLLRIFGWGSKIWCFLFHLPTALQHSFR